MTISLVKIILNAIKTYCSKKDEDCTNCPFRMEGAWFDYCMFMGSVAHEGRMPSDWELDKVEFKDDLDDYAVRKQNLGSTYGSCVESDTDN